jgi:hypothetical protein
MSETPRCECGHRRRWHKGGAGACACDEGVPTMCSCPEYRPAAPPASTGMETPSEPLCTMCGEPLRVIDADRKWCENSQCSARNYAVFDVRLATPPVSEDIGGLIDALEKGVEDSRFWTGDGKKRRVAARTALDAAVASLRRERDGLTAFARDVTTNYDHDADAHRYNNGACLVCKAERALTRPTLERTDG